MAQVFLMNKLPFLSSSQHCQSIQEITKHSVHPAVHPFFIKYWSPVGRPLYRFFDASAMSAREKERKQIHTGLSRPRWRPARRTSSVLPTTFVLITGMTWCKFVVRFLRSITVRWLFASTMPSTASLTNLRIWTYNQPINKTFEHGYQAMLQGSNLRHGWSLGGRRV